jgi:PQQ-like domain
MSPGHAKLPPRPVRRSRTALLALTVLLAGFVALPSSANAVGASVGASNGELIAITPTRVLDTRTGLGGPKAPVRGGSALAVTVTGRSGVPTSGVSAVALTVTAVKPLGPGYVTVSGHGLPRPTTSNLNLITGRTVGNMVVVVPGADGRVDLFNGAITGTNLLVDISGYYRTGSAAQPGGYSPLAPTRLLDTRIGLGGPKALVKGMTSLPLAAAGHAGIPTTGVGAIALTVTVVRPVAAGHITVFPQEGGPSSTSNVNFAAGETVGNLVFAIPGPDGRIHLFNGSTAGVHLLVDISGYYRTAPAAQPGGYSPLGQNRLLDTRHGAGGPVAPVLGQSTRSVAILGHGGVPTSGVAAVAVTVTAVDPSGAGHVTVSGHRLPRPSTSNVNFTNGQTVGNLVIVVPGADGKIDLFNGSAAKTDLLLDISGYYASPDQYASSKGGPGNTKNNSAETNLAPFNAGGLHSAWNANQVGVASQGSPALVDGIAYVAGRIPGQSAGVLLAADAQTGQTLWMAATPNCLSQGDGLTISAGMAFIGCGNSISSSGDRGGIVVAVDLSSHRQVWSRKISSGWEPAISVADGMVFTTTYSGTGDEDATILALDGQTGQVRYQIDGESRANRFMVAKDGQLVVSSDSTLTTSGYVPASLKVYDSATGALRWTGTGDHVFGGLTVDAGHILLTDSKGVSEWSEGGCGRSTCAPTWTTPLTGPSDVDACYLQPGGADGHTLAVTLSCTRGRIVLVNESTGAIVNTIPMALGDVVREGAVRSGNLLWVPGGHGGPTAPFPAGILAFDATCTSSCLPVVDLVGNGAGGYPSPSIAVAGGTVLVQTWMSGPTSAPEVLAYRR